jgi:hypothetical protein
MLRSHRAPPPLSLPQVDNSNDFHPPLDLQLPPTLAGVAAAVAVVVATATVAGVAAVAAPAASPHRLLARAGAAPLAILLQPLDLHH